MRLVNRRPRIFAKHGARREFSRLENRFGVENLDREKQIIPLVLLDRQHVFVVVQMPRCIE